MTSLIPLKIWLGISVIAAFEAPPSPQPQPTFRIFADLKHTGILAGPLTLTALDPSEFGIVVPLPSGSASRDRWLEKFDVNDPVATRLGQLRIETTAGAGNVVVSIESDSRRCLRLFRKGGTYGGGCRPARIVHGPWHRERTGWWKWAWA